MSELTLENFVQKLKAMSPRDRNKVSKEELISLIIQLPDESAPSIESFNNLSSRVDGLVNLISFTQSQVADNSATIRNLERSNESLINDNSRLIKEVTDFSNGLNNIEQYLRVDNIEVVGLPQPDDIVTDEQMVIEIVNQMSTEEEVICISSDDISICHEVPSRRHDKKRVVVCKFISRKCKLAIIKAKKNHRRLNYRDSPISINDHLSQQNRHLFSTASTLKKEFNFKYLWTKNGNVYIRKDNTSDIIHVTGEDVLSKLRLDCVSVHQISRTEPHTDQNIPDLHANGTTNDS